nr:MAG: putative RNA-dependent RNA polymerase [Sanya botourmia-like virus 15]
MVTNFGAASDDKSLGLSNSRKGVRPQRCSCRLKERRTKEVIETGLKILRVRFRLPAGELPYLRPDQLSCYLLKLLSSSPSGLRIPRCQNGFDSEGFPLYSRLPRMDRWRLAQAVASIKRILPQDVCEVHPPLSAFPSWSAKQCGPDSRSSADYLAFARQVCAEVFPSKWDTTYRSFCRSFVPKSRSRAEKYPCGLPMRADKWWSENSSRREFLDTTIRGKLFGYDHPSRYSEVPTNGKLRPMIVPSVSIDLLGPLHKTIYQCISGQSWLLKGDATVDKLRTVLDEEWKTSVDLVAASDGLTLDVADVILDVCQSRSFSVPAEIYERARRSLRPLLTFDGDEYRVTHGQMMGQYLSFPLLCVQSYIAARWATRGLDAKYKINGDDCLIGSSSNDVINRYPSHLVINYDKTAVRRDVAEINSTQFLRFKKGWKLVVTARKLGGDINNLSGHVHLAQACLNAGNRWVDAFMHTRIGRRQRVRPTDLGLSCHNRFVFLRVRGMPHRRVIPFQPVERDDRLEIIDRKPTEFESDLLRETIFNGGRFVPRRPKDYAIKDLAYKRVNISTVFKMGSHSEFIRVSRGEKKEKKEIYFRVSEVEPFVEAPVHVPLFWERACAEVFGRANDLRSVNFNKKQREFEERYLRGRSH